MSVRPVLLGAGLTVTVLAATLGLGATAASAATTTTAGPRVAGTTQTISFHAKKNGTYRNSAAITFTAKTFSVPSFQDSGSFTNKGAALTFTVQSDSGNGDKGCVFRSTYSASASRYVGTYSCPDGFSDDFAVGAS